MIREDKLAMLFFFFILVLQQQLVSIDAGKNATKDCQFLKFDFTTDIAIQLSSPASCSPDDQTMVGEELSKVYDGFLSKVKVKDIMFIQPNGKKKQIDLQVDGCASKVCTAGRATGRRYAPSTATTAVASSSSSRRGRKYKILSTGRVRVAVRPPTNSPVMVSEDSPVETINSSPVDVSEDNGGEAPATAPTYGTNSDKRLLLKFSTLFPRVGIHQETQRLDAPPLIGVGANGEIVAMRRLRRRRRTRWRWGRYVYRGNGHCRMCFHDNWDHRILQHSPGGGDNQTDSDIIEDDQDEMDGFKLGEEDLYEEIVADDDTQDSFRFKEKNITQDEKILTPKFKKRMSDLITSHLRIFGDNPKHCFYKRNPTAIVDIQRSIKPRKLGCNS